MQRLQNSTLPFSFDLLRLYPATIIPLMALSTGITVDEYSGLQCIERITPRAAPIIRPVGPLTPSIQPGRGSLIAAVTKISKNKSY